MCACAERMPGEECVYIYHRLFGTSMLGEPRKHAGSLKLDDRWFNQGIRAIEVVFTWSQIVKQMS